MSFAADVKKELTSLEVHREHAKAELAALIRMNGSLNLFNQRLVLNIQTENAAIARRIYSLLKDHFNVRSELLVRRKMKLKKNNVYIVRLKQDTKRVLDELSIMDGGFNNQVSDDIIGNTQKMRSYLRGAFMATGSINNPETSRYHLEIYSIYETHNQDICKMLNYYGLNARTLERRNGYISYLKGAEHIANFLTLIGATNSMLKFEDVRIVRDMRNSVNRLVNCETANMNKTIDAASKQIQNIQFIEDRVGLKALPDKLQEIAELRLAHPEISLKELGEMLPTGAISKSGINHRIRKINEFADKLKENVG
ncbi:DNA-binding protein WhiA [Tetragenococcus koreensis]|uniref:Probable cell division protein WhiA n=1 Tax=Tetragenococcus koreensis TaxID=290335 RepID=A0AAN4UAR6_9ENTE|nr:DNA-binding protein WhiA [Tetragenococcus koreensis]MDN6598885.1 DNA-binding protein WhiA [Tetragenococcus koreensis]GEQ48238.1 sporulation regulator WhiA [Tetragenococcus koreensis]GEQ50693.1 sporulation regulator WhiA [Tetragenococcus koreensis]GEQ53246.1 sporulation regulator WhiA [Tetragenococcus koreensis]GEQ55694.1 sporulation regulator WhiA [Tetragenococcus koreensis]